MKRILSVILSLALLASLLIIPMSVSADTTDVYKGVINAVEGLKFNDANSSSLLQEFAVPMGSNIGGNGNGTDAIEVFGETGYTSDSCMQLVDADTLTQNPGLGSQAVKVLKNHATKDTAWGSNPQNTIRYTLNGVNQNEGIYLYDIGYLVIYVKTDVALNFNLYTHTGWALSNICDNQKVSDTKGEYVPVVIDLTAFNWNQTDSRKNCFAFRKPITSIVLSIFKDDGTAIDANDIVFGSMKYVPFEKALRDFKYDFDLETLGGYKATSANDGSVEMSGGTMFTKKKTDKNLLRYRNANKDRIDYTNATTVADIIARAETISNDAGYYTDASFQNLQEKIDAAKAAFVDGGSENRLALLKAEASKLYKTEEIAQPLFKGSGKITTNPDISSFNLTDYQKETLGSRYIVVNNSDTADYYYKKPGAESNNVSGDEWDIKIQDYDEVILPIYNNSNQKWVRNGKLQTIIGVTPNNGPKDSSDANKYLNFAIYDNDGPRNIPVLEGLNTIDLADLWVRVYYKGVSKEKLFKNYSDFREYNTAIASTLGVPDYDNLTVLNINPKYWDNAWKSSLLEGQTWILGSITGKKYFKLTDEMETMSVSKLVTALDAEVATGEYANTEAIKETLDIIGVPPVIKIEGNKLSNTETDTYCGSVKVTVTDPNGDLRYVKVNGDKKTDEFKNGTVELTEARVYAIVAGDAMDNDSDVSFTIVDHELVYSAEGAVITETCKNCAHEETLTLRVNSDNIAYDGTDKSGLIDPKPSAGFVGTYGTITFKQNDKPITKVEDIGEYTAEVTVGGKTAVLKFTVNKPNDPAYEYPGDKEGVAGEQLSSIELPEKFDWNDGNEKIKFGVNLYDAIYDPQNENYQVQNIKIQVTGTDTTAPTGTITIKQTVWDKITEVLFGWFIDAKETVTITGSDTGSGVKAIYYYVTDTEVDTAKITDWKEYKDPFKIEKEGNNVVYAKVVDVAEKESIINTTGIVLDTLAPDSTIDLDTYYGALNFTVNEANLDSVKVKDADSTSDPVDVPVKDGVYTVAGSGEKVITITDKVGHKAEYKVNIIEIKGFDPTKDEAININVDLDEDNVEIADMEKIAAKVDEDSETVTYFNIDVKKVTDNSDVTTTSTVYQIPVEFNFDGRLNIRVLHNHGGTVKVLEALTSMPTSTDDYKTGTFFADKENNMLYIYTKEFSTFAVAFHVHSVEHIDAVAATATADGNIEYWYCEGCDTCFSDAIATKEITKESTVVKYVSNENGNNTGSGSNTSGSNTSGGSTDTGNANTGTTLPGGISPGTGQTAMAAVLFAILLGALAVMGISVVKSRKAKSK